MDNVKLAGVVPIIPVPFHEDEAIDETSLARVVDWVASCRLGGMCLPAYGSEFYKLSESERHRVIEVAIETNRGRVPLVAQANHGSARVAASLARQYEAMGADVISFAIPRQFGLGEADVLRYCETVCSAVSCPVLVQDYNPGGVTIGAQFIGELHRRHPNFAYAKLEEPLIVDKLVTIRDAVGDAVGILEGWGGYYMLEAIPAGCCGIMPGVPIAELLNRVFQARLARQNTEAFACFGALLPYITFHAAELRVISPG
jgi:2-keto-3-deoxy-L-arabinonate dehydratase